MRISTEAVASSLAVSLFAAAQYCSETLVAGRSSQRVHEKQIADILRYHVINHSTSKGGVDALRHRIRQKPCVVQLILPLA